MFYLNFTNRCKDSGISPTALLRTLNISTSKLTAWKNGSMPNSEFLIPISEYLQCSIDYLLLGKESYQSLNEPENELISIFRKLPYEKQISIRERALVYLEDSIKSTSSKTAAEFSDELGVITKKLA
jgi:transcriptional regulator with XRE-family HTH domain